MIQPELARLNVFLIAMPDHSLIPVALSSRLWCKIIMFAIYMQKWYE
jgi:hypothetical protein